MVNYDAPMFNTPLPGYAAAVIEVLWVSGRIPAPVSFRFQSASGWRKYTPIHAVASIMTAGRAPK
jgi:hypothetical protein